MGGGRTPLKIVFFGTPEYVLPIVKSLHKKFVTGPGKSPITAVVTQPPKPTGRKQLKTYSAIDRWAFEHKIPIYYSSLELLKDMPDADMGVLAAFSEIIPDGIISLFPKGIFNVHPSLLPRLRGASPVQASIITEGDKTGVTIMKMDSKLDHGPIITQFKEEIRPDDTTESLRRRLFERSAEVLTELIEPFLQGKVKPKQQDETQATYARKITKEDGFIPPKFIAEILKGEESKSEWKIDFIKGFTAPVTAELTDKFIRAMNPWPGAWTFIKLDKSSEPKRLKILKAHLGETTKILELDEVQLESKNPVSWKQFKEAFPKLEFKIREP